MALFVLNFKNCVPNKLKKIYFTIGLELYPSYFTSCM